MTLGTDLGLLPLDGQRFDCPTCHGHPARGKYCQTCWQKGDADGKTSITRLDDDLTYYTNNLRPRRILKKIEDPYKILNAPSLLECLDVAQATFLLMPAPDNPWLADNADLTHWQMWCWNASGYVTSFTLSSLTEKPPTAETALLCLLLNLQGVTPFYKMFNTEDDTRPEGEQLDTFWDELRQLLGDEALSIAEAAVLKRFG